MSTPAERGACLRWIAVGAFDWRREGCTVPETIRARARDVAANAPVSVFTEGFQPDGRYQSAEIWQKWQTFAPSYGCGQAAKNPKALATLLKTHGWKTVKGTGGVRCMTPPVPVDGLPVVAGSGGFPIDTREEKKIPVHVNQEPATTRHYPSTVEGNEPGEMAPPGFLDGASDGGENEDRPPPAAPAENSERPPPASPAGETGKTAAPVETAAPVDQPAAAPPYHADRKFRMAPPAVAAGETGKTAAPVEQPPPAISEPPPPGRDRPGDQWTAPPCSHGPGDQRTAPPGRDRPGDQRTAPPGAARLACRLETQHDAY